MFGKSQDEIIKESHNLAHRNKKRSEELQAKRNEDLTNSILALAKVLELKLPKRINDSIEDKIEQLTNKIN